jgi:hypothetical protein
VSKQTTDVVQCHLAESGVFIAGEQGLTIFPDQTGERASREPLSPKMGLGIKVTVLPYFLATFLMQYL